MANWGIVIGINHYERFKPLLYAQNDAIKIREFFKKCQFEQVVYFSDNSDELIETPDGSKLQTTPGFINLTSFLTEFFPDNKPPLAPGDNLWFFF